eukprot:1441208-Pyramimonas_sp.AAC.1
MKTYHDRGIRPFKKRDETITAADPTYLHQSVAGSTGIFPLRTNRTMTRPTCTGLRLPRDAKGGRRRPTGTLRGARWRRPANGSAPAGGSQRERQVGVDRAQVDHRQLARVDERGQRGA